MRGYRSNHQTKNTQPAADNTVPGKAQVVSGLHRQRAIPPRLPTRFTMLASGCNRCHGVGLMHPSSGKTRHDAMVLTMPSAIVAARNRLTPPTPTATRMPVKKPPLCNKPLRAMRRPVG